MDIIKVNEISINTNTKLRTALIKLNETGLGILFITDKFGKLVGIITDGDIRRFLLENGDLDVEVNSIMNRNFISLPVETENEEILRNINSKVKIIPLVNIQNELVDYASINKIKRISVASPLLNGNELAYVTDCIRTNWISSQGKYVSKFEKDFSNYHNGFRAVSVCNGTVAIHLALITLKIGKGDEVIVPDFTFAASVNAIIHAGAIPVLIDVDKDTWNIDTTKIENLITNKTKAIMLVHLYGLPCNIEEVIKIAKKYKLLIIEDCAEALGSKYKNMPIGTYGDAATFSFYGNKTITTGEGGMILFKNNENADRAEMLRDHGMLKTHRYWHQEIGYNYRLTNIQAAIGVAQFERLDEFVKSKIHIANTYTNILSKYNFFQLPIQIKEYVNSYWLYTFLIKNNAPFGRNDLIDYLNIHGIETRPVFYSLHLMPPYKKYGKFDKFNNSLNISKSGISLPSSVNLNINELTYICDLINLFCEKYQ